MDPGTRDRLGSVAGGEPATPGSYGQAPSGFRLPESTRLGPVRLQVADLERSLAWYEGTLGLHVVAREATQATLAVQGSGQALVQLHELAGARPAGRRARLGLYHFAILLPDRAALGRFVRHLMQSGVSAGAGDHLVSEAFYLQDPDGLGIEVYADRPRAAWRRVGRELAMATDPVDVASVIAAAGDEAWSGMPAGSVIGHVHLHVGDLQQAADFYAEALGFDRVVWSYPGALFLGAGGYHHHLGTNTWAGSAARPAARDDAGLLEWTIQLPDEASVAAAARSIAAAGYPAERISAAELVTYDPWGIEVRLRAPR